MRINKKLVPKDKIRKSYSEEQYVRVDFEETSKLLLTLAGLTLIGIGLFTFITWATPSKYELDVYHNECNTLAGNNRHYISRTPSNLSFNSSNTMYCHAVLADGSIKDYPL